MYIYQASHVSKAVLLLFFTFIFFTSFSQTPRDSIRLNRESNAVLEKKITFSNRGGSLQEVFDKLSGQQGINIAFANHKIESVSIAPKEFSNVPLAQVLESILYNTGFDYLVIGTTIAIVPSKKQGAQDPSSKSGPKHTGQGNTSSHVYPTSPLAKNLSKSEQKLLRKIYGRELRLRKRDEPGSKGDSIDPKKEPEAEKVTSAFREEGKWYLRVNTGLDKPFLRYRNVSSLDWKKDVNFSPGSHLSLFAEVEAGMVIRNFFISSGLGVHSAHIESSFTDPNPPPPPPGGVAPPIEVKKITETYSMLTLPVRAMMIFPFHEKLYWSGGAGIRLNYLRKTSGKGNLKDYFTKNSKEKFTDQKHLLSMGVTLHGEIGYHLNQSLVLSGGLEFMYTLNPFYETSLYKFYSHSLSLNLSLIFFLN